MRIFLSWPCADTQKHLLIFFLCCIIHYQKNKSLVWPADYNGCHGSGIMLLLNTLTSIWSDCGGIVTCCATPPHYHKPVGATSGWPHAAAIYYFTISVALWW